MVGNITWEWRVKGLTRDGMAEHVSRDQFLRRVQGQPEEIIFPCSLTISRIGNPIYRVDARQPGERDHHTSHTRPRQTFPYRFRYLGISGIFFS